MGGRHSPNTGSLARSTAGLAPPEPNPPFVFPLQPETATSTSFHQRTRSSVDTAGPRLSANRSRPKQLSINALPAFEFGGDSTSVPRADSPTRTPSRSPVRKTPPPHHPSGHRRGGSEFIGGDLTTGFMSTSPTKTENTSPPLPNSGVGAPNTRRKHAHRRSGAISQHDISMIMKPSNELKGASAPNTPADSIFHPVSPPELDDPILQPTPVSPVEGIPPSPSRRTHFSAQSRARVAFNETPEYIPRPLSTISSETSSSMSTFRANHSVSNSISSIVSGGTSSPTFARARRPAPGSIDHGFPKSRANTAATSLLADSHADWESVSPFSETEPHKRPSSAPVGDAGHKSRTVSPVSPSWDGPSALQDDENAPDPSLPPKTAFKAPPVPELTRSPGNRPRHPPSIGSQIARPRTSPEPKVTKRQRKVQSWAGSMLSRKGKQQLRHEEAVSRRSPTPPSPDLSPNLDFSLDNVTFDEDTTCVIETDVPAPPRPTRLENDLSAWKPRESSPPLEDNFSPMLDIDAALGSFDIPGQGPTFDEVIGGFPGAKRRMHSSGETGGFTGPGMHYHRRAESAPEMVPFDRSRFGFPRPGSNPTMAEAIVEEEEEAVNSVEDKADQEEHGLGLGVNIVETDHVDHVHFERRPRRIAATSIDQSRRPSKTSMLDHSDDSTSVEIVPAEEEPRFSVLTKSSDESTITPTLSHDALATRPASAPIDFALTTPSLTFGTPETPSAVSSTDFEKTSFDGPDVPRLHTATSSIDRATLSSSRAGEQGLGSVDDVPSLTSSASTMISAHPTHFSNSLNRPSFADRSSSLSAAVPARTRPGSSSKRSSLASLSRLVGGSYNKSKLNIAELAPPDSPGKTERKKGNRLSRMMKGFWKSKERLSAA